MKNVMKDNKKTQIILIRGIPGSGKSYITAELEKALGKKAIVLDPDNINYASEEYHKHVHEQIAEGVDPKLHAYRFLRAKAYEGIARGKTVIWNQPFTNLEIFNKMTANFRIQAEENSRALDILVVEIEIDHDTAKSRVISRKQRGGHGPSDQTFDRFVEDYTSFAPFGYRTVVVNGRDDPQISISAIIKNLAH